MKKKILFVTEASFHPTGYSVYTKEVLSRLCKYPELEVAELACYAGPENDEINQSPWKIYPNIPTASDEQQTNIYNSSMSNKFGEYSFNSVLLDFQPDFVMDIRDWWMLEFEERSPFRDFYNWAIMPTVDATPQNVSWIDTYASADAVFAYSEFGRDTMLSQSKKINFKNVASPCASEKFFIIDDKNSLRKELEINKDAIIFGTVMRNQRRKLYPDLFKAFRMFLDNNPDADNCFLYCHTGYPDVGWDIPELLRENDLYNKVLFTYKCRQCNHIKASLFNDAVVFCEKCKNIASTLVGVTNKMEDTDLNKIYNLFDVYIQWANSEGWGMPQLEAAYAGLPIISVNYSAMQSLVANIEGIGVNPISLYKELETGCMRAVPDNKSLSKVIESLYLDTQERKNLAKKCHDNARKIYNWDYTAEKWARYFIETPTKDRSTTWMSEPKIFNPITVIPENIQKLPTVDQVNWLFVEVLGKPELLNKSLWKRLVKDLTYRASMSSSIPGYYYNDYSHPDIEKRFEEFSLEKAHKLFLNMRNLYNQWEMLRSQKANQK